MDRKSIVKKSSKASLNRVVTQSSIASKGDYEKRPARPSVNISSSRRSSVAKAQVEGEEPEFKLMPDLLPDLKVDASISNSGFFKKSELVLLGDVVVRLRMLPKKGRSRITAVKSHNPITVFLGTNYDYFDQNLGHRIRWADTNEVWGPGWHPLKFIKSMETLIYAHKTARIAKSRKPR